MDITVLFGSPHSGGHTEELLGIFLRSLPGSHTVNRFDAYRLAARPCIGCMKCRDSHECIYGDLDKFFSSAERCDLLVVAAPVYFRGLPSPVKSIIDRTQRFYGMTVRKKKPCVLLACGGAPHADARIIEAELRYALPCLGASLISTVTAAGTDTHGISNEAAQAAISAGELVIGQYKQSNNQEEPV